MYSMLFEEFMNSFSTQIPIGMAIFMELFVSLHMTAFVFYPFGNVFFPKRPKLAAITLFAIRASILIIMDFFLPGVAMADFFAVFIGAFTVFPIFMVKSVITSVKTNKPHHGYSKDTMDDDQKLKLADVPKFRMIMSIIYGIIGALVLSSKFIFYQTIPTAIALIALTGFYVYVYAFYPKKYEYKEANDTYSYKPIFIIYILIILSSLVFYKDSRIIYKCNEKECTIVKYMEGLKASKTVTIPSEYKGKKVTTIGSYAFYDNDNLVQVEIPSTVKIIKENAFTKCDEIEVLEISSGTKIEDNAIEEKVEVIEK